MVLEGSCRTDQRLRSLSPRMGAEGRSLGRKPQDENGRLMSPTLQPSHRGPRPSHWRRAGTAVGGRHLMLARTRMMLTAPRFLGLTPQATAFRRFAALIRSRYGL